MRPALRLAAIGAAAALLPGAVAAGSPPAAPAKPQRIVSMNQCEDLLLLQLVPKSRIAAITYNAHDSVERLMPGADAGVAINHGTAEDVINLKPDLILSGDFSTPLTRKLAKRVGVRVVEVPSARSFADVRRGLRIAGAAVGEPARAEALIREMDAKLTWLAAHPPARRPQVVAWSGGTSVPGKETLANEVIEAAGAENVAARPGVADTTFDVEQLLRADPDALLFERGSAGPSLAEEQGRHRVVRQLYDGRRIGYDEAVFNCGLPQSADQAVALRRALDALPPRRGRLQ